MQTSIDRFGRVIIPKTLRDHLGLDVGAILEIEEQDDGVLLRVVHEESGINNEEGVLVFTGTSLTDIKFAVQEFRARRHKGKQGIEK